MRKMTIKIHISRSNGEWYAMPGNNNRATRFALIPAISYCRRMNAIKKGHK